MKGILTFALSTALTFPSLAQSPKEIKGVWYSKIDNVSLLINDDAVFESKIEGKINRYEITGIKGNHKNGWLQLKLSLNGKRTRLKARLQSNGEWMMEMKGQKASLFNAEMR